MKISNTFSELSVTLNGKQIKYIHQKNTNYNWEEARNACQELALGLLVPDNQAENNFFADLATDNKLSIGISDEETDGVWKNVNTGLCQNII